MASFNGEDILHVFKNLNIDLNDLNPNVIKAWFDTDNQEIKNALYWMCSSLSTDNYLSPSKQAEFDTLPTHLNHNDCLKELQKLDPTYVEELNNPINSEELKLMQNEIELLEFEYEHLHNLIEATENLDHSISEELNHKTKTENKLTKDCELMQSKCLHLCQSLDNININIEEKLENYNLNDCFNNYIDIGEFEESIHTLQSVLLPYINECDFHEDSELLEEQLFTYDPETYRERIFCSTLIYLTNKVEIHKLKSVSSFLENILSTSIQKWNVENSQINDTMLEKKIQSDFQMLNKIASKVTDGHLNELKMKVAEYKLQNYQNELKFVTEIMELVRKNFPYVRLLCSFQVYQNISIENVIELYQKLRNYVNGPLSKCRRRIQSMENVIEDYKLYSSSSENNSKFLNFVGKILETPTLTLETLFQAVKSVKTELNELEYKIFSDSDNIKQGTKKIREDIETLRHFIMSGPTDLVVLVPLEFIKKSLEVENYLKKEQKHITQALQISRTAKQKLTPAQMFSKNLWISFLTNPSNIDVIFEDAERKCSKK